MKSVNLDGLTCHFCFYTGLHICSNPVHLTMTIIVISFPFSDAENVVDLQVPFLPSVEVLVKALVVIAPVVSARGPDACVQLLLCSHHPCIIGTAKRNAVWRVSFSLLTHY